MKITNYRLSYGGEPIRAAMVADFHDRDPEPILAAIREAAPHVILVTGDVVHDASHTERAMAFLRGASIIAPTFCSIGNHETKSGEDIVSRLAATGATVLDNAYVRFGDLVIGGLTSGFGRKQGRCCQTPAPQLDWLDDFCGEGGTKILLSHHPEYYAPYLAHRPVDLILSGHAHGGQWRAFGRGLFAPGQGLFPYYTGGAYRGRNRLRGEQTLTADAPLMIVGLGLCDNAVIPRINNPEELIILDFLRN